MQLISSRRMKVVSVALLLSGGSVVLTQQWLNQAVRHASLEAASRTSTSAAPASGTQVLVAAAALPAGEIVKPGQLRWQPWPLGASTGDYLTQANTRLETMDGAVVRSGLQAGEPIGPGRLVQPGDRSFLAAVLRPGYRAVTVNLTAATGVAGFVMPGDHVDLLLNTAASGPDGGRSAGSETILQDVRILAMDQRGGAAKDVKKDVAIPSTATLEVTPKGAEIIGAATQVGPLALSLRSLAEPQTPAPLERVVTHTSLGEALGATSARSRAPHLPVRRAAAARPAARLGVQLFRGSQSTTVAAPAPGGAP